MLPWVVCPTKIPHPVLSDNVISKLSYTIKSVTENIQWDLLDRWDYADPSDPKPPGYSLYTFFTLQQSLIAFFCLLLVQFVLLFCLQILLYDISPRGLILFNV